MMVDTKHFKKLFYAVALMEEMSLYNTERKYQYKLMKIITN